MALHGKAKSLEMYGYYMLLSEKEATKKRGILKNADVLATDRVSFSFNFLRK